jgi:hypothetical protein
MSGTSEAVEVYTFSVGGEDIPVEVPVSWRVGGNPDAWKLRAAQIKLKLREACRARFGAGFLLRDSFGFVWLPSHGRSRVPAGAI